MIHCLTSSHKAKFNIEWLSLLTYSLSNSIPGRKEGNECNHLEWKFLTVHDASYYECILRDSREMWRIKMRIPLNLTLVTQDLIFIACPIHSAVRCTRQFVACRFQTLFKAIIEALDSAVRRLSLPNAFQSNNCSACSRDRQHTQELYPLLFPYFLVHHHGREK